MKKEFIQITISKVNPSRVIIRQVNDITKSIKEMVDAFHNDMMYDSLAYASQVFYNWLTKDEKEEIIQSQIKDCLWYQIIGEEPEEGTLYLVLDGDQLITSFTDSDVEW